MTDPTLAKEFLPDASRLADSAAAFAISSGLIDTLKSISLYVSLFLGALFVWFMFKLRALHTPADNPGIIEELNAPAPAKGGAYRARWEEILRHMDSAKEAEWKFAVIEADKLFESVLQKAGFPGQSLGEKLINIQPGQLQHLDGIWYAHKIRNRLAHDVDYFLRYSEAKQAIDYYDAALQELEAI